MDSRWLDHWLDLANPLPHHLCYVWLRVFPRHFEEATLGGRPTFRDQFDHQLGVYSDPIWHEKSATGIG